jgi:hypothetical protein
MSASALKQEARDDEFDEDIPLSALAAGAASKVRAARAPRGAASSW